MSGTPLQPAAVRALEHLILSSIRYEFGSFSLDPQGVLTGPKGEVALRPRTFALLHTLVSHAGRVLSHDELLDQAWGIEHLSPSSLKQAVSELRKALEDDPNEPEFVQTLPRRGYRFVMPVATVQVPAADSLVGSSTNADLAVIGEGTSQQGTPQRNTAEQESAEQKAAEQVGPQQYQAPLRDSARTVGHPKSRGLVGALVLVLLVLVAVLGSLLLREKSAAPAPLGSALVQAAAGQPSSRPSATVLGFLTEDPLDIELGNRLAKRVSTALVGSGTEQQAPITIVDRVEYLLAEGESLGSTMQSVGGALSVTMVCIGSLRLNEEQTFDAQLAIFDARTGQVGAYSAVTGVSVGQLEEGARRLINELWAWNGDVPGGSDRSLLPVIDAAKLVVRPGLTTGLVVQRLRRSMEQHTQAGVNRPPFPALIR